MSNEFELNAEVRTDLGKGASRRLRRLANLMPAIIYGGDKAPSQITIPHKDMMKALENEAFYSHILTLDVAGTKEQVILKDLQRHPAKAIVLHADFLRVSADQELTTNVPLHFLNEEASKGVKLGGGAITHNLIEVEIRCLPADLPEYIEIDMIDMDLGDIVHLSDLKLPKGVSLVQLSHDHDLAVASVQATRGAIEASDEEDGEEAEGASEE
ncbi:50S ribosomal protein L25/general stress protein Ctc [Aestuariirhabdus sp. Z084]|uniref:50S ribosomal protein L25/general stress protein Ctc n=1 Tax=Aestuariirhabdus haliotis TaxID=2918751 RepID=UPI00201B396B|nr:50S ribosomal protein L25/general stress protein Ctc [Aestuariirhabdus haliotis]MCL6415190.1 50S ribosomal protein L25/general stress protein Ctc [Aestuariirhabdus haliotis]MCL6420065.1 50S ribosomal protein L25/general stress protein Ctc [Aestuariirhabdus haliotis]